VIEPNRLTDPAERAARERVEVVFAAVDSLAPGQLTQLVIAGRDPDARDHWLGTLEAAVAARGRDDLLDEARDAVRAALQARLADMLPVGAHGITTLGASRVEDRVEVVAAIDDAVSVAVAEDLLEPDVAAALAGPGRSLLGLDPLPGGGEATRAGGNPIWEPSPDEWLEAEVASGTDAGAPMPGVRGMRLIFVGAVALFGMMTAITAGLANDQLLLGILAAAAVGAVCWTFATFRRAT
jgi:hypothetical protein